MPRKKVENEEEVKKVLAQLIGEERAKEISFQFHWMDSWDKEELALAISLANFQFHWMDSIPVQGVRDDPQPWGLSIPLNGFNSWREIYFRQGFILNFQFHWMDSSKTSTWRSSTRPHYFQFHWMDSRRWFAYVTVQIRFLSIPLNGFSGKATPNIDG